MTQPFVSEGKEEVFKYSLFLVLCNRITTATVSVGILLVSECRAWVQSLPRDLISSYLVLRGAACGQELAVCQGRIPHLLEPPFQCFTRIGCMQMICEEFYCKLRCRPFHTSRACYVFTLSIAVMASYPMIPASSCCNCMSGKKKYVNICSRLSRHF